MWGIFLGMHKTKKRGTSHHFRGKGWVRSQNKCLNAAFAAHHGTELWQNSFISWMLSRYLGFSPPQPLPLDAQKGNRSRLDKCRQMRTGHLRRVCHTMHLSEMLSYFDGNIHCQFMRACRLHCWLRNVGIKRAVLTDSCTAVAFLTCHTRTRACWRL